MRPNDNTGRHGTKTGRKTTLRIHSEKRIKSCGRYLERKKFLFIFASQKPPDALFV
jgi:hypothetical protein